MSELTKKIKIAMLFNDVTYEFLEEKTGYSRQYLSPIINGKRLGVKPERVLREVQQLLNVDNLIIHYKKEGE